MRILITGAAGFIGFHLAKRLCERGDLVVGVDDLNPFYSVDLKKTRAHLLTEMGVFFHHAPLESWIEGEDPFDIIIHLAGQPGVRNTAAMDHIKRNITDLGHLLEWCRQNRPSHFLFASSSSVYGEMEPHSAFHEKMAADRPLHVYGATKRSAELLLHAYVAGGHLSRAFALRFFNVYGPWGRPDNFYFTVCKNILEGTPISLFSKELYRDMTYIDDLVDGIILAMDSSIQGYEIFNLCNHRMEKVSEIISILEKKLSREALVDILEKPPAREAKSSLGSVEKSRRLLGFDPKVTLEEGLSRFAEWYLATLSFK